ASRPDDLDTVLATLWRRVATLMAAEGGYINRHLAETEDAITVRSYFFNPLKEYTGDLIFPIDSRTLGSVARRTGQPVTFLGDERDLRELEGAEPPEGAPFIGLHTRVFVPIRHGARIIGTLGLVRPGLRPFADQQVATVQSFADQAAIAIENARLF